MLVAGVLVSCSCCNKVPETRQLKTPGIYSTTVLETRKSKINSTGLKSRSLQGHPASERSGEKLRLCLSDGGCRHPQAPGHIIPLSKGATLSLSLLHLHVAFSSVYLYQISCILLIRIQVTFNAHLVNPGSSPHLKSLSHLQRCHNVQ